MKKRGFLIAMMSVFAAPCFAGETSGTLEWINENRELALTLGGALYALGMYLLPPQYAKPLSVLAEAVKWAMEKLIWAGKTKGGLSSENAVK